MKKFTTAALLGMMAVSGLAGATDGRQSGIGAASAFGKDSNDVFSLPSQLAGEGNAIYGEFGKSSVDANSASTTVDQLPNRAWGGATMKVGDGVVGIWGNRAADELNRVHSRTMLVDSVASATFNYVFQTTDFTTHPTRIDSPTESSEVHSIGGVGSRIEVQYAVPVSDSLSVGFGVNRSSSSLRRSNDPNPGNMAIYDGGTWGFNLGAEAKDVAGFDLIQLGGRFSHESMSMQGDQGIGTYIFDSAAEGMDLRFRGMLNSSKSGYDSLVLSLDQQSELVSDSNWTSTRAFSNASSIGYARVLTSEMSQGIMGLLLQYENAHADMVTLAYHNLDHINVKVVAGGETKLKEWVSARAGIGASVFTKNYDDVSLGYWSGGQGEFTSKATGSAQLTTGLTLHLGNLDLDGSLNQNIVYSGGYLVSGLANSLFSQVSATYSFGGNGDAPARAEKPKAKAQAKK